MPTSLRPPSSTGRAMMPCCSMSRTAAPASASGVVLFGVRVMTSRTGMSRKWSVRSMSRVRSPAVTTPMRLPAASTTATVPRFSASRTTHSRIGRSGVSVGTPPASMTSATRSKRFFTALHPGGALAKNLLLRGADVMLAGGVPTLTPDRPMRECVVLLAEKRGTVAVVDAAGSLIGVVTAGDLTRLMERTDHFLDIAVRDVMTRTPKSTTPDALAGAAVRLMEQHGIMALPVLDGGRRLVGMVHLHDLMKAGAA